MSEHPEHPEHSRAAWTRGYQAQDNHPQVHGANLGLTAEAYLDAGGFPPLSVGEDVALIARPAGRRVIHTAAQPVLTSARRAVRALGGFGDHLQSLAV